MISFRYTVLMLCVIIIIIIRTKHVYIIYIEILVLFRFFIFRWFVWFPIHLCVTISVDVVVSRIVDKPKENIETYQK